MKTIALGSFFVIFAITAGMLSSPVFADHSQVDVTIPQGASTPGCETTNECFIPNEVTIDVGGEVTWTNSDTAAHTVTAGTAADGPSGEFDSSLFMAGTTFSHTFDKEGEFPYFCMVHPWMSGTIIVQAAGEEHTDEGETSTHESEISMEGPATATGMLPDGTMVSVWTSKPTAGQSMQILTEFKDSQHVNYDMTVTQNGKSVYPDGIGLHDHQGTRTHQTAPLDSADPVDITITFKGYGLPDDPKTGPIDSVVQFSKVVPEFGTIATMILAIAVISIVAVTTKSKVIPRL